MARRKLVYVFIAAALPFLLLNCFSSDQSLPDIDGPGQIIGKVVGPDGTGIPGVQITTTNKGTTVTTTSTSTGIFTLNIGTVQRGDGFNVQFQKTNFDNATQAAVVSLPNLQVNLGNVTMYIQGGSQIVSRQITGQIFDNFSYKPLANANVFTIDSAGFVITAQSGADGKFTLTSSYFMFGSSFVVGAFKANYIARNDLVYRIMSIVNDADPVRLYNKFGRIYGYVQDDTIFSGGPGGLPVSLDGVTVSLTDSNNQSVSCLTSVGNPGTSAFDSINGVPDPLPIGSYCPDLYNITSPMSLAVPNPTARTNNSGGFKFQDDFLFIGNRYTLNLSKTSAACTSRASTANGCYKSFSTYADLYSVGDNAMASNYVSMKWDSWIYGSVQIQDPYLPASTVCPVGGGCPGAGCTCALANVNVYLYDNSNTFLTQTTTDSSGKFLIDDPRILRGQTYKVTFDGAGIYSRRIGFSDTAPNPSPPPANIYQAPVLLTIPSTASLVAPFGNGANQVAGACAGGAICLTALQPPSRCVVGTVKDFWSGQPVDGAVVGILDGGWRVDTTGARPAAGGYPALASGQFLVKGTFNDTSLNAYTVQIAKPGYTGEILVAKQTFTFTHDGSSTCPAVPYNLDIQLACDATGVGPTGGNNCVAHTVLHPIGVFGFINSGAKQFQYQIKQTYEKFLTEKNGLTISARTGALQRTSNMPAKNYDYDAIYLHFDDTPRALPNVPAGNWTNHVGVNPTGPICMPDTQQSSTYSCTPKSNGVLTESIGNDSRITPWGIQTYVYYNFYAAAPGLYTIQTTGGTDTYMTLTAQTGAAMGSDDDSGSGSNASIGPINLLRGWYYVKISNKGNNVYGFFDLSISGPPQSETNYSPMLSAVVPSSLQYQTVAGTATYGTTCAPDNGNLVVSWYDKTGSTLYIAAPGENGGCSANATIEKHGPVGDIIRGRFSGNLRPINPTGINATVSSSPTQLGYFNVIRQE